MASIFAKTQADAHDQADQAAASCFGGGEINSLDIITSMLALQSHTLGRSLPAQC